MFYRQRFFASLRMTIDKLQFCHPEQSEGSQFARSLIFAQALTVYAKTNGPLLIKHRQPYSVLRWIGPFNPVPYMSRYVHAVARVHGGYLVFSLK
jgi:hypothetical protein